MRVVLFLNQLGIGGTEKAACRWARGLVERGHEIQTITLKDGPRRADLETSGIIVRVIPANADEIQKCLLEIHPDVIHAHAPGHPHEGDVLGEALASIPKIPVVQTNVFGQLNNPKENAWTDFRLFISWTSCVQAARRCFLPLNEKFFSNKSVAVYPVDPDNGPDRTDIETFRRHYGIEGDEILLGRLSRPEPNKWTDLPLEAFRIAARHEPRVKLLLREPPAAVRHDLENARDRERFVILPATSDSVELAHTMASLDVVLHTSIMGESFGYGIAEPMNYGKPVIANSTPWLDQAQIELVRHRECGFIGSTPEIIAENILKLANDVGLRTKLGRGAKSHIRKLADPVESTNRLEEVLRAAVTKTENARAAEDLARAQTAADYLDEHQFGHSWREQLALRPFYYRVRFHQLRKAFCLYFSTIVYRNEKNRVREGSV